MRVAVVGFGAIGSQVVAGLQSGEIAGAELAGVVVRRPGSVGGVAPEITLADAIEGSDLVVECAGGPAAREIALPVLEAGTDLLLVSMGVLADADFREQLQAAGPGRLHLSSGAIGGLDILAAAGGAGGLNSLSLTSTKAPRALVQPWMSEEEAVKLRSATSAVTILDGSVQEAIEKFPASLNIAVALAAATGLWDAMRVRLIADPDAPRTLHQVVAAGSMGSYEFSVVNELSAVNPATSGITAHALLQGIRALAGDAWRFV